jgi:hypothetical protein
MLCDKFLLTSNHFPCLHSKVYKICKYAKSRPTVNTIFHQENFLLLSWRPIKTGNNINIVHGSYGDDGMGKNKDDKSRYGRQTIG